MLLFDLMNFQSILRSVDTCSTLVSYVKDSCFKSNYVELYVLVLVA